MRKRRKTTKKKTSLATKAQQNILKALALFIISFLAIIFLFGDHGVYQLYRIKMLKNTTQKRIEELRAEKQEFSDEQSRLETDLNYIESIAREKYRMAKSGEKVFKVITKENK